VSNLWDDNRLQSHRTGQLAGSDAGTTPWAGILHCRRHGGAWWTVDIADRRLGRLTRRNRLESMVGLGSDRPGLAGLGMESALAHWSLLMRMITRMLLCLMAAMSVVAAGGCAIGFLGAGLAQNFEYQKLIEVLPRYEGLEHRTVAVIVDADLATLYEYPTLCDTVAAGVTKKLGDKISGIRLLSQRYIRNWQFATPQWNALPYGDIARQLNVDRVVLIDIQEFRLHPRGNRWMWDGECVAMVGIIERDNIEPDELAENFQVTARFPKLKELDRQGASEEAIKTGLYVEFIKRVAWLFYPHLQPKYPDQYKPDLDRDNTDIEI